MQSIPEMHKSLSTLAYTAIRENILAGHYKPGEWLRQKDLSQQLHISYTPIREALDKLVADGLVEKLPHRGVRVSSVDENEIVNFYCLRLLLEPLIGRMAALTTFEDKLDQLTEILVKAKNLTSLEDMPNRRRLNREFHWMICKVCGNSLLERLYEIVWNRFPDWMFYEGLHRQPNTLKQRLDRENNEHWQMLKVIGTRDADLAGRLYSDHIKLFMKEDLIEVFRIPIQLLEEKQRQMGI